jgi:hypothetical protein
MKMPRIAQPADRRMFAQTEPYAEATAATEGGVTPQLRICTPCVGLPSGRHCINLGPFGRRCVNIPNVGRWRVCCRTRFGWPPVSCGVERC